MNPNERYIKIIETLSSYYGMNEDELIKLLTQKENKYLLLLFLDKYKCLDKENLMNVFKYKSMKSISYNLKKAEEKLLINRDFREKFFEIEQNLLK
ncbi:MAG: hypothetical protein PUE01_13680 [Clostridiaceae bacterium]|nr:hypothetical protein [Clostridiaceae bacterium]